MSVQEITIISPTRGIQGYWRDIWRYRELFAFFVWRDLTVRYKQTLIGVSWSLFRPILTLVAFTFVFGKIAKLPSNGVAYPVLVFAGLLPWQFFASALSDCGNSLVNQSHLLSKIYFPRLIIPGSSVIVSLVDFLISLGLLAVLLVYYQVPITWRMLTLPLFSMLVLAAALSAGLLIATVMVRYRDFRIILPFILQFGLYASPVGYTSIVVPEKWRTLYALNPMANVIDGFRWALLGGDNTVQWWALGYSIAVVAVVGFIAVRYFRATERSMADVI
jgi:lipopolysaccharide transport system permease protein